MISDRPYSEFSSRLHEVAVRRDIPLAGAIELTARCNLRCVHCCIRDSSQEDGLTFSVLCRILDEIAEAGCLWLLLTGGEPLLREDFWDIYAYAKRKGLLITLFTNGTLVSESAAAFLARSRPFSVEITLYGATKQTYEAMTGVDAYDACISGIKLLVKHRVPLSLKTMVTTVNRHELEQMKEFAQSLGLRFKYDPVIRPRLNGSKAPYNVRLPADEVAAFDIVDERRRNEWIQLRREFRAPLTGEYLFNCGAGRSNFHITPDGKLLMCSFVPEPSLDLRTNSFASGYRLFAEARQRRPVGKNPCAECEHLIFCDSCPGVSMLEGDKSGETPVAYYCSVAQRRAEYFLHEADDGEEEGLGQA